MSARWVLFVALLGCARVDTESAVAVDAGSEAIVDDAYCPTLEPIEGAPCPDRAGHQCSYGDHALPGCHRLLWCGPTGDPHWQREHGGCVAPLDCPTVRPTTGTPCTLADGRLGCAFPDASLCFCTAGDAGSTWTCITPETSCPASVPNAGEACVGDRACNYGFSYNRWCIAGARVRCASGRWNWSMGCTSDK